MASLELDLFLCRTDNFGVLVHDPASGATASIDAPEEQPILDTLDAYSPREGGASFRAVNNLLGEVTNLIWGAFKNRYVGDAKSASSSQIQVPLIINHKHRYISFGTENPQLCFLYTLTDENTGNTIRLYQRFIFNLSWSPEDFKEIVNDSNELVESGELELF